MRIVLLSRVEQLGVIGDVVEVKPGYARNFLLPQQKALRATPANLERFQNMKAEIEANNLKLKSEAEKLAAKMEHASIILVRNASDSGFLFGSVRSGDIAEQLAEQGFAISKSQVRIAAPIKSIGNYMVEVVLHPEVFTEVPLRVMTTQEQVTVAEEEEGLQQDGEQQDENTEVES
ncbi:MAG: 50S ribosomal protein L9 [Holosporales bacterium]|jgi:large subunit ribosomal protein L9|nr:50S ribosomal protein L9 [Holosporales bacterium]